MPVFKNKDLSLATKRAVYRAVVLAVILYGAETWMMKAVHKRCLKAVHIRHLKAVHIRLLNSFHNRCI